MNETNSNTPESSRPVSPKTAAKTNDFPPEWLQALDFAKYACKELEIDDPKEKVETLRVLLIICC